MNAFMAVDDIVPPPTFNTLDSRQRSRLIRSSRKLGEVLGTTPQLVEHVSPVSSSPIARDPRPSRYDRKRRQGSIFEFPSASFPYDSASSATSSVSSLALPRSSIESSDSDVSIRFLPMFPAPKSFAKHVREKSRGKGKRAPLPTPLVLRLNAVPLPPSDPRLQSPITPDTAATLKTAILSATTPLTSTMPPTPTTPRTPITPTPAETRRKRLAKLKRTLGENIPQELIMPFRTRTPHPSPVESSTLATAKQSQSRPEQHHKTMPVVRPPKGSRRRSLSVDFSGSTAITSVPKYIPPSPLTRQPMPSATSSFTERSIQPPERRSSRVWVTGAGTWTGEWNRKDIKEVQHQLRTLRIR